MMINLKRMKLYRQIWKHFNLKFSVQQIGEVIELIEESKIIPTVWEDSYEIWQKYLEVTKKQNAN